MMVRIPRSRRVTFEIKVQTYDKRIINLNGFRIVNEDKQPLILWPGFYQNGFVYDLMPNDGSLAEYLWAKEFDIWIIHSRGTDGSGGRKYFASLDDYASFDIPTVIEHISKHTNIKPIYVGHSQGGITAIMSMMGAYKLPDGTVDLLPEYARIRQSKLKGLVTLSSFLDFTFSKSSGLQDLVQNSVKIKIFGKKIRLLKVKPILNIIRRIKYLPMPVPSRLRHFRLTKSNSKFRYFYFLLDRIACLPLWEFLYHIPNVSKMSKPYLFYKTLDGIFSGILNQFYQAVIERAMWSTDQKENYSAHYDLLMLPVSFVSMEYDTFADPIQMKNLMFDRVSSKEKHFTEWKQVGHEDHFMNLI